MTWRFLRPDYERIGLTSQAPRRRVTWAALQLDKLENVLKDCLSDNTARIDAGMIAEIITCYAASRCARVVAWRGTAPIDTLNQVASETETRLQRLSDEAQPEDAYWLLRRTIDMLICRATLEFIRDALNTGRFPVE